MRPAHVASLALLGLLAAACGAAPPPQPQLPAPLAAPTAPAATPTPGDPFAVRGTLREEPLVLPARLDRLAALAAAPNALPAPPAACEPFVKRAPSAAPACSSLESALAGLDSALAATDANARDALLVDLESCTHLPTGMVRALRADLAPAGCADAIVAPYLAPAPPRGLEGTVHHALLGLAVAARLARAITSVPQLGPPYEKERVLKFVKGPVAQWLADEAGVIQELSQQGAKLQGYGRGVAALEAGLADLRLVEAIRKMPVADFIGKDAELRGVYEAALEQMLDPRKDRGRDAALVGLRDFATIGVLHDDRLARARIMLSQMYAGRRIDALDGLALPDLPPLAGATARERLAARLPTFYAGLVLEPENALGPGFFRGLLERGVPLEHRLALRGKKLDPSVRALYARARVVSGQTYWRAVDFDEAARLALDEGTGRQAESTFYLALALGLRGGPEDAAAMMRRPSPEGIGTGEVAALDALAKRGGATAAIASYDAAWVRFVTAPKGPDAARWRDVAQRFRAAADLVAEPGLRARALDRAKAADDIAAASGK